MIVSLKGTTFAHQPLALGWTMLLHARRADALLAIGYAVSHYV